MRILCDRDVKRLQQKSWSGTELVKRMICQLVELHPTILLDEPDALTPRTISEAEEFDDYWEMLELLLRQAKETFIVIDRIDLCVREQGQRDVGVELVERLQNIISSIPQVQILITTAKLQPYPKSIFFCRPRTQQIEQSAYSFREY